MKKIHTQIIRLTILFFGWTMLFLPACIEDKGNYTLHDLNEVSLDTMIVSYGGSIGNTLTITPILTYSLGEDSTAFIYKWYLTTSASTTDSRGTLSTEKVLNIVTGGEESLIDVEGTYYIMFQVTNIQTEVCYYFPYTLKVEDRMQTGYIMMCETGADSFDLELISLYDGKLTQYHSILDYFGSSLPHTGVQARDMVCFPDNLSPKLNDTLPNGKTPKQFALWIVTDQYTNRVRVEDYHYEPAYNISYQWLGNEIPRDPVSNEIVVDKIVSNSSALSGLKLYCMVNGDWYFYNYYGVMMLFYQPVNYVRPDKTPAYRYTPSPYLFSIGYLGALMFNETDNRFEIHKASNAELSKAISGLFQTKRLDMGAYFDWENPDYSLIYMGNRTDMAGFAVVYNRSTTEYELLQMQNANQSNTTINIQQLSRLVFPASFDVAAVKYWAYHQTQPYLYCATDDRLFKVHLATTMTIEDITEQVLPVGHKFSLLKSTYLRFPRKTLIAAATYDPNGEIGKNGELSFYSLNATTGNLTLAKHPSAPTSEGYQINMQWGGFGKVISVDYKQPN